MTATRANADEAYEPPRAEDIDTTQGPTETVAMVIQQSPPSDSSAQE